MPDIDPYSIGRPPGDFDQPGSAFEIRLYSTACNAGEVPCNLLLMPELPDISAYLGALQTRILGQSLLGIRLNSAFLLHSNVDNGSRA